MKIPFLIACLFIGQFCIAQKLVYQKFDIENKLPSLEFYHGISMADGTYWFISDRGPVQYNGSQFTNYDFEDGLADIVNFDIIKWNDNKFLLTGMNGQLTVWENGSFRPFQFNDSIRNVLEEGDWIGFNGIEENKLYFMTQRHISRSFVIDLSTGVVEVLIKPISFKIKNGNIEAQIEKGRKYVYLNREKESIKRRLISNGKVGVCWDASFFLIIDFQTKESTRIESPKINFINIIGDNLWVSTARGLYKFNLNLGWSEPEIYFKDINISSVLKTPGNGMWVLSDEGLFLVPNIKMKNGINGANDQEEFKSIYSFADKIVCRENTNLHIISENRTETVSNVNLDPFDFINLDSANLKPFKWSIDSLRKVSYNFFLGDKELIIRSKNILENKGDSLSYLINGRNIKMLKVNEEEYFLSTSTGFYKIYLNNNTPELKLMDNDLSWGNAYVKDMVKIPNGLLLGVNGKGLYSFKKEEFKKLFHPELENIVINNIYLENDSTLWVASNVGLKKLILNTSKNAHPNIVKLQSYTKRHGLNTNLINDICIWKNRVYIATVKGLLNIDKEDFILNENSPNIVLESFRINNNAFEIDSANLLQKLNNNQNDISLNFKSSSLFPPNNKEAFKFTLYKERQEKKWTYTDNNSLQFANLKSGNYKFEIAARTQNDLWSEHLVIPIQIKSHYSETLWFWIALVLLLGLLTWLISQYYFRQKSQRAAMEYQLLNAEMETLRSQMNPHFIFNALNSMQGFIFSEDKRNASRFLHKFSTLIRNSLNYSKSEYISLKEELDFIDNYLQIEAVRFDHKFTYFFEENGVDKIKLKVPPLIIQPLVENSIKHGFKNLKEDGHIKIECNQRDHFLEITVSDNGKGIQSGDPQKEGSYGLQNIKKRLMLLSVKDGQTYQLRINEHLESPWKTSIKLELPIQIKN